MRRTTMLIDPLPDGWRNVQLGDLCDRVSDSYRPVSGGETPYIGLEHLAQGFPAFVGRGIESDIKSQKTAFRANDVLFGKLRPYLRKGAKASFDGVCSTDILAFRPQEGCEPDFLQYIIHSDPFIAHAIATTTGVQHPRTSWPSLREFKLSAPPVSEQKGISKDLASVQKSIETQEQIIQTTTELKQALMQKLFSEGLRGEPQKETEIGLVPESWGIVPFDKFVTLQRGYDLRKQDFRSGSVPVIGATQVIGYHDTANVKAPCVTVVRSGSSAGKPLFISEDFWAHNVLLYVKDFQGNIPRFVYYKILALNLAQYRQGVAVPTLNRNTFSAIKLALPSSSEQHDIADALDAVVNRMEVAKREKFQQQDLLRTLLCELMSAKIRVCTINLPVLQ
jgi:type I restriction enzyme S subunit